MATARDSRAVVLGVLMLVVATGTRAAPADVSQPDADAMRDDQSRSSAVKVPAPEEVPTATTTSEVDRTADAPEAGRAAGGVPKGAVSRMPRRVVKGGDGIAPAAMKDGSAPRSIVLVANGKSASGAKLGAVIDKMDFVARFNYFKIQKGAGATLGTKTDLWFLSEMKSPSAKEFNKAIRPRQYIVPVSIPARPGCSKKMPKRCSILAPEKREWVRQGRRLRSLYKSALKLKSGKCRIIPLETLMSLRLQYGFGSMWPSTGLIGIIYVLQAYPSAKVYLHGFDFTKAKRGDCKEPQRVGNGMASAREYVCKSPALGHFWEKHRKSGTVHNMFAEGEVIRNLIRKKKVAWLTANSPNA